jgi:phage repressor protein C with HTH and peptisase S24 domain
MQPTLYDGDRLLVLHGGRVRPGRLVVVRLPGGDGGDARGVVAVKRAARRQPDGWWVERDNPAEGVDSWLLGPVPEERVLAVVLARVWPPRLRAGR